jgi:hypothetical protein
MTGIGWLNAEVTYWCFTALQHEKRGRPRPERILPAAAWYFTSSVFGFSAQSAEKPNTNKRKNRSAEGKKR